MIRCFIRNFIVTLVITMIQIFPACEKKKGKGWYEKCSRNDDCMVEMECIFNRHEVGFCSRMCFSGPDYCRSWFGQGAACEVAGHCFKYCNDDTDCPGDSACYNHHDCQMSPLDSDWAHEGCDYKYIEDTYNPPIITNAEYAWPRRVSMVWTGSEFGLAWDNYDDGTEIFFTRISLDETKLGDDVKITDYPDDSCCPYLAWSGSEYGLAWHYERDSSFEIYFTYLSSSGEKLGMDAMITGDVTPAYPVCPIISWTGSEYGMAWSDDGDGEIYFIRVSPSGEKIGSETRITNDPEESFSPYLAWTGSEYGMVWTSGSYNDDNTYIKAANFLRLYPSGDMAGAARVIPDVLGYSAGPSIAWTGSEFGVAWTDDSMGHLEIYFSAFSSSGEKVMDDMLIDTEVPGDYSPNIPEVGMLVWAGSEFCLGWTNIREVDWGNYNYDVNITRISIAGNQIGGGYGPGGEVLHSVVWTGSEYGIAWEDEGDRARFIILNCGP